MAHVRTRVSVVGFKKSEVQKGLGDLLEELGQRPWLLRPEAAWDPKRSRLVVTVEAEGGDVKRMTAAALDEVWDCVIACLNFSSDEIGFELDESIQVPSEGGGPRRGRKAPSARPRRSSSSRRGQR